MCTYKQSPVVLFIMPCKMDLTSESEDEILKCDHSNESYLTVPFGDAVYCAGKGGSNV